MSDNRNSDSTRLLPASRQAELISYVSESGQVTVAELAERFGVSVDTVRRDLDQLDSEGQLIRTHGGAVSPSSLPIPDSAHDLRLRFQTEAKDKIGRLAASLVPNDSSIIVNAGTTSIALVHHLSSHSNLTVATNNLRIPGEISQNCLRDLYMFGGLVRLVSQASLGPVTLPHSAGQKDVEISCDLALISVGAVSITHGYSTSNFSESNVMAAMMRSAEKVVVLADSSKLSRKLFAKIADLSAADYLVTDTPPPADMAEALAEAGVTVITE